MKKADATVNIGADGSAFTKATEEIRRNTETLANSISGRLARMGTAFTATVEVVRTVGSAIAAAGSAAISPAAQMETARLRLANLLGSEQEAASLFSRLVEFAAKTPFEMPGLMDATAQLLNAGISADSLMEHLLRLGNVASISGKQITDVSQVYAKAASFGTMSNEIAEQFTYAGLNIRRLLAEQQGVSVEDIFRQITKKQITIADVDSVLAAYAGSGGRFGSAMEKESATMRGLLGTLSDGVDQALAKLGQGFLPQAKKVVEWLGAAAEQVQPVFESLGATIGEALSLVGKEFAALGIDWKAVVSDLAGVVGGIVTMGAEVQAAFLRFSRESGRARLQVSILSAGFTTLGAAIAGVCRLMKWYLDAGTTVANFLQRQWSNLKNLISGVTEEEVLAAEYASLDAADDDAQQVKQKTEALREQTEAQKESNAAIQERLALAEKMRSAFEQQDAKDRETLIGSFTLPEQHKAWLASADLVSEAALDAELATLRAAAAADRATQAQLERAQQLLGVKNRLADITARQAEEEKRAAEKARQQAEETAKKQQAYARQRDLDLSEQQARLLELRGDTEAAQYLRDAAAEQQRREELVAAGASRQEADARAAFERRLTEQERTARESHAPAQAQWIQSAIAAIGGGGTSIRFGGQDPALKEAQRQTSLLEQSLQALRDLITATTAPAASIPVTA